jgi:hypothetical protein
VEEQRELELADGDTSEYATTRDGYIFRTDPFSEGIYGYAGPIVLAVYVDEQGVLRDFRILQSDETPAYLEMLQQGWLSGLTGRNVFRPDAFTDVDAVTGATMTAEALLSTLQRSGSGFGAAMRGSPTQPATRGGRPWRPDSGFLCLAILMSLALAARYWPNVWLRRALLVASLLAAGVLWNLQYSSQHVMALLSLRVPGNWLTGPFFLMIIVPALVLLFGNVYCGYVCPFGALQELVGEVRRVKSSRDLDKGTWRFGRVVKYGLLLLLAVLFALTRDYRALASDPLSTFFSSAREAWVVTLAIVVIGLSVVFRRFWCRSLCPAGAFLALLNGVKLFRRVVPSTEPKRCDLGVRSVVELDCICCDRCRHA